MCAKHWDMGYEELLDRFHLPSLSQRRLYLSLCTMYKIVHGYYHFTTGVFIPRCSRLRSSSSQTFVQPYAHTNAFFIHLYQEHALSGTAFPHLLPAAIQYQCSSLPSLIIYNFLLPLFYFYFSASCYPHHICTYTLYIVTFPCNACPFFLWHNYYFVHIIGFSLFCFQITHWVYLH